MDKRTGRNKQEVVEEGHDDLGEAEEHSEQEYGEEEDDDQVVEYEHDLEQLSPSGNNPVTDFQNDGQGDTLLQPLSEKTVQAMVRSEYTRMESARKQQCVAVASIAHVRSGMVDMARQIPMITAFRSAFSTAQCLDTKTGNNEVGDLLREKAMQALADYPHWTDIALANNMETVLEDLVDEYLPLTEQLLLWVTEYRAKIDKQKGELRQAKDEARKRAREAQLGYSEDQPTLATSYHEPVTRQQPGQRLSHVQGTSPYQPANKQTQDQMPQQMPVRHQPQSPFYQLVPQSHHRNENQHPHSSGQPPFQHDQPHIQRQSYAAPHAVSPQSAYSHSQHIHQGSNTVVYNPDGSYFHERVMQLLTRWCLIRLMAARISCRQQLHESAIHSIKTPVLFRSWKASRHPTFWIGLLSFLTRRTDRRGEVPQDRYFGSEPWATSRLRAHLLKVLSRGIGKGAGKGASMYTVRSTHGS